MQEYSRASWFHRSVRKVGALRPVSWLLARTLHHVDPTVSRLTHGRHTLTSALTGLTVVSLTTRGARSGKPRSVPLLGFPCPTGLVVIASNYAQTQHPGWYYNLRAHPEAEVEVRGERRAVTARLAHGDERAALWARGLQIYPGWRQYEARANHREIGVFVLEPSGITRDG